MRDLGDGMTSEEGIAAFDLVAKVEKGRGKSTRTRHYGSGLSANLSKKLEL